MYCIGLTGTIASGKTSVAQRFKTHGIDIINTDTIAKNLTQTGTETLSSIRDHFGQTILYPNGELHRRKLRDIIFQHPEERLWLENLLHPLIRKQVEISLEQCQSPYCIIEIPLLRNRQDYPYINRVLLVRTTLEQQIERLQHRDHHTAEETRVILNTQPSETILHEMADDIIENTGTLAALEAQVDSLHIQYISKYGT